MASLIDKSNQILNEKNTNLKPEYLKAGITCLGVTGTYTGSSSTIEGVKLFETVKEMQADTTAKEGDLAIVYRSDVQNIKDGDVITSMTFPKTVIFDTAVTTSYSSSLRNSTEPRIDLIIQLSSTNFIARDMNRKIPTITYTSSDGITYTRTDSNEDTYEIGETTISRIDEHICKFIQIGGSTFEGIYKYSNSSWILAPTQLTTTHDYVYSKEFYGKNGVEIGTLTQDISNSFTDINAEVYGKIQNYYDNLEPRVLTDSDKTIDKSIHYIPTKSDGTPLLDTSSVNDMYGMFQNCTNLTTIPSLDTSSVTNMERMFDGCENLITIPELNTSNVTNTHYMFNNCKILTSIPLLNTSSVNDMYGMFQNCTNLTTIPSLDTSSVTDMESMFWGCRSITIIPQLDTSSVTNMNAMFYYCTSLTTIPQLDTSSVNDMYAMFYICTSLSDESLNNILAMCTNATSYTNTKTLAYIGLSSEQATKCTTLSNYSAFTNAGWTTGY